VRGYLRNSTGAQRSRRPARTDGVTIALAGEDYTGKAPCNSYTGTLSSGFITTEVGCPELDLEQRYYAALGSVDDATIVDGMLRLTGGGAVLEFAPV